MAHSVGAEHARAAASASSSSSASSAGGSDELIRRRHRACLQRAQRHFDGIPIPPHCQGAKEALGEQERQQPGPDIQRTKPVTRTRMDRTVVEHDPKHFGEAAHTIRHWLRGGQVVVPRAGPLQWHDCLSALLLEDDYRTPWFEMERNATDPVAQAPHTDVHHWQVPDDFDEFENQLIAELTFPLQLERTTGYEEIEAEVAKLLGGRKYALIVWHRDVERTACSPGSKNRAVAQDEHEACQSGAGLALAGGKQLSATQVLHLGDAGPAAKEKAKGGPYLLDAHWKAKPPNRGTRSMLQQLQFIRAVVKLSGARLAVGERAGLLDLISLAGGIPICQFIAREARLGNDRLSELYLSGCGMGCNVVFSEKADVARNTKLMRDACEDALRQRAALEGSHAVESCPATGGVEEPPSGAQKEPPSGKK